MTRTSLYSEDITSVGSTGVSSVEADAAMVDAPSVSFRCGGDDGVDGKISLSNSPSLVSTSYDVQITLQMDSFAGALVHPLFQAPMQKILINTISATP